MSAAEHASQLTDLSDSLKATNALISRLAKLQSPTGSTPGDAVAGVRTELAQDIHDSLKQLEEELELLAQEAEEYNAESGFRRRPILKESDDVRLTAKVTRLGEELVHSRQQFRNAQIAAKFAHDEAKRREREAVIENYRSEAEHTTLSEGGIDGVTGDQRELLFARHGARSQQQRQQTKDEILVNASSDVTAALRRTHDLLSTELSRSRFAQETFDESTNALAQLGENYSNLDGILSSSRNLLGTLLRSQKSDTWYLETAFYVLISTLAWLFFRRILLGPFIRLPIFLLNWFLWKPLFLFLSITGVITSGPTDLLRATESTTLNSRPPLIVQPSAKGRPTNLPPEAIRQGVPVGIGGAGAKVGKESILQGQLSEGIGKMADNSARQTHSVASEPREDAPRRGDGTVLQERGDLPQNPKKRNFEADIEDKKHEAQQQQQQQQQQNANGKSKRDEL